MTRLSSKTSIAIADAESGKSALKKKKTLQKFGRNTNVGTSETTIMRFPTGSSEVHETYVSTNAIDSIASLNSGDTSLPFYYEGHTISGGAFTFISDNVTLDGSNSQTRVALPTPVARISRAYQTSNTGATKNAGQVCFFQNGAVSGGSVVTPANVHMTTPARS